MRSTISIVLDVNDNVFVLIECGCVEGLAIFSGAPQTIFYAFVRSFVPLLFVFLAKPLCTYVHTSKSYRTYTVILCVGRYLRTYESICITQNNTQNVTFYSTSLLASKKFEKMGEQVEARMWNEFV